ncbi:Uncharacterised protein [Anaerobiospirillum thomasii]|uniref:hypothetical protein n=1 Tax=Anaerobiospirillum thomasii TaxID=179995 RepID=UPI000D8C6EBC|nr:hypothetical protein [Anaerobiospirillum thomasii]SPT67585.1 Uncharacterised protein [Anaerobiospirillum thomasii]
MKDLFNSLKDQINPQSSSSSLGSLGGLLGSAAAGGILGALLGGSKSVKRTAKKYSLYRWRCSGCLYGLFSL